MMERTAMSAQVVFVDSRVDGFEQFVAGLDSQFEWHRLEADRDGLSQMAQVLAGREAVAAIHVVAHGAPGALQLGATWLDRDGVGVYASELGVIGRALRADGDVLLYGCDVGQGEAGRAFVESLAAVTGADVAASVDVTGPLVLGGDGVLERVSGVVETAALAVEALGGVLAMNTAPAFGNGLVTTDFGGNSDYGYSVALQADGKILVVGNSQNSSGSDFALARYNSDGSLDTSFSGDGLLTSDFGGFGEYGRSAAVQADGKILVAGEIGNDFALARYTTDGVLDASFSGNGWLTTDVNIYNIDHDYEYVYSVALQADGKILVSGATEPYSNKRESVLARYNTDGTLDKNFGVNGKLQSGVMSNGYSVAVQADGKILVAGENTRDFALARYTADGALDTSFSDDGWLRTNFVASDYGRSVAVQADGKILVAGIAYNGSNYDFTLIRYTVDGALDASFSDDGWLMTDFGNTDEGGYSLALQADGKILVAGDTNTGKDTDFAVARYTADGVLDTSFSGNGWLTTDFGGSDLGRSLVVQADGKILVAGTSDGNFALARYTSDGQLDLLTFNNSLETLDAKVLYDQSGSVVLDSDVQIFDQELSALGNYAGSTLTLARRGGASPDDVFSASGTLSLLKTGNYFAVEGVTIGRVLNNADGTLKLAFNTNATQSLVNRAMQQIAYDNTAALPPARIQIEWTFDDGNSGAQGTGGALEIVGHTDISNPMGHNVAPVLANPLPDISFKADKPLLYTLPTNTFTDTDAGNVLTYNLDMADGTGIPPWLTLDPLTGTLTGTPTTLDIGTFDLRITATDLVGATISDTFQMTIVTPNKIINGTPSNDTLIGDIGDDELNGLAGNDNLDGRAGNDIMQGGRGNDTYHVRQTGDSVIEASAEGVDWVNSYLTAYTLSANVEHGRIMIKGAANLTGNALNNTLQAGAGNNILDGAAGLDIVSYATASTDVTVNLSLVTAQDTKGSGFDTLRNIESLIGSRYSDTLTGNSATNVLRGGDGNDRLIGGLGNDTLDGGLGSDTADYHDASSGVSVNLSMGAASGGVGNDTLIGIEHLNGSEYADTLIGDTVNNTLRGEGGNDRLEGGDGNDSLDGGAGDDTLIGGVGNDGLDGGTGNDVMQGGRGNDTYHARQTGDSVVEGSAEGVDWVNSYLTVYTLSANVEHGRIMIEGAANLTGNALNNTLQAGAGNNILDGADGLDTAGYATAIAGVTVNLSLAAAQDTKGSGFDTLHNIENLIGSRYSDTLTGNSATNVLRGGAGNDRLIGGLGNDTLDGGSGNDTADYRDASSGVAVDLGIGGVSGGAGNDTLISIEHLSGSKYADTLIGNAVANTLRGEDGDDRLDGMDGNDTLIGGPGDDTLIGGAGNDILKGGAGNDILTGGLGQDSFVFDTALSATTNCDRLTFNVTEDTIKLENAIFKKLAATGTLSTANFASNSAGLAQDADDYIIHDTDSGALYYDATATAPAPRFNSPSSASISASPPPLHGDVTARMNLTVPTLGARPRTSRMLNWPCQRNR
jgi:uncharacterized delta-60 repeat protein